MRSASRRWKSLQTTDARSAASLWAKAKSKASSNAKLFALVGNGRIANAQPGAPQGFEISQIRHIKLHFPVKGADSLVEITRVPPAIVGQAREYLGIQPRDAIQHSRLDMVHLRPVGKLGVVILDGALLEFAESLLDLGGVVDFRVVFADRNFAALDQERVLHGRQVGLQLLGLRQKRGEAARPCVVGQVVTEGHETAGAQVRTAQVVRQVGDGAAIGVDRIEKQRLLLSAVVARLGLFERIAHRAQRLRKCVDMAQQAGVFEIAHDFLAVEDRIDVMQGGVEKWREIVFLLTGNDRCDDLI